MKQLKCEMCGSTDLIKQDGVFVCQSCGIKYSVEDAKKMMSDGVVEITGTVKINNNDKINNLYQLARRAKGSNDNANALKYYEMILIENPNDWEAMLYSSCYTAMQGTVGSIAMDAENLKAKVRPILETINDSSENEEEILVRCNEVYDGLHNAVNLLFEASKNTLFEHYERFIQRGTSSFQWYSEHCEECMGRVYGCYSVLNTFGDIIVELFDGEKFNALSCKSWKKALAWNKESDDLNSKSGYVTIFKNDQRVYSEKIKGNTISKNSTDSTNIDGVDAVDAEEIAKLVKSGQVIEAIKIYREATGVGLAEAKEAIDKYKEQIGVENNLSSSSPISNVTNSTEEENSDVQKKKNICIGIGVVGFILGFIFILSGASTDNIGTMSAAFPMFIAALIALVCGAVISSNSNKNGGN